MRIVYSEELNKMYDEVDAYRVYIPKVGKVFREDTPNEIKEKFELWKKLVAEEDRKAKEILEYE